MSDFDVNSIEYKADLEMKAKFCLTILGNIEKNVITTFEDIIRIDNIKPDSDDFKGREKYDNSLKDMVLGVVGVHATELEGMKKMVGYLKDNPIYGEQYKHDIDNFLVPVVSGFDLMLDVVNEGAERGESVATIGKRLRMQINNIVTCWYRCRVALEDMALRIVSEKHVSEKFLNGVDIKVLKNVLDFFSMQELQSLRRMSSKKDSQYKEINNRVLDVDGINWPSLEKKLDNKKIVGNDGLIGNFLVNALRNSLKDRISATNVKVKINVEDDELIIRVEDDGKGMEQKHLDPDFKEINTETGKEKKYFIFDKGVSDTDSSGLGITDFHTRLASTGGALYVVSKRHNAEPADKPVRYQSGGSEEYKKFVKFDYVDSGTVFEIHLKLEDKNKI